MKKILLIVSFLMIETNIISFGQCTSITSQPLHDQVVCQNGTPTALSVTAVGLIPSYAYTYLWYRSSNGTNSGGTPIPSATGASYMPSSANVGGFYYYVVVSGDCYSVVSDVSVVGVVAPTPFIGLQPSSSVQTVCQDGWLPPLRVSAGGIGVTYQWYSNTINSNSGGSLVSGATDYVYTPPTRVPGTNYYYAIASSSCTGASVTSDVSGAITVNSQTSISSQSTSAQTVCLNGALSALSVTAVGTSLSYQWYSNTTNSNSGGALITGATTSTYTPSSATVGTTYYYVVVSGSCGSATSSTTPVTVNPLPTAAITPSGPTTFCQGGSVTLTASPGSSYLWSTGVTSQVITVSTSGNYSVTVTNLYGCSASSSPTTITVNSLPTATITPSGPTTFCQSGSVTLTASAGSSYLWSTGATSQAITVGTSGNYSVTVYNSYGCSASSSVTTINVITPPSGGISYYPSNNIYDDGYVQLTAPAGNSYSWSTGSTNRTITVYSAGTYSVTVYNGCSQSFSRGVINKAPTGPPCNKCKIETPTESTEQDTPGVKELTAFPNPATDMITVAVPWNAKTDTQVLLFDMFGKQLTNATLKKGEWKTDLSVSNCTDGLYVVKVGNGDLINAVKVMVHK